ncbi:MAG TPA: spore germination protein [Methylomusa anaerophila]|uniref:Spore germination protein A1 n=1 Tax=Methylomusa anaerophila TaxID=1930071 RepID=A0A348AK88_9FIRM|nr:spore germination protein [Methylomusa anaerophila]BBB91486.1 spore germination protein A1 [Methylomusa anaerophila]HML89925.1 spore germination protein [Methylomusa anaerophila]
MKHSPNRCFKKLSAQVPSASLTKAAKNLDALRQVTGESTAIAEELNQLTHRLKSIFSGQAAAKNAQVSPALDTNFVLLQSILGNDLGLITRKYDILDGKAQAGAAYIESMTDKQLIGRHIIEPLLLGKADLNTGLDNLLTQIQEKFIFFPKIKRTNHMNQVVEGLLNGETVLFVNGLNEVLIIDSRQTEKRAIERPENEGSALAALESFTEDLDTNCSMVIKRLPTPDLRCEMFTIGRLSRTKLKLFWIEGVANTNIIAEVRRRINRIDIDNVDGIGTVAELIGDNPVSIFPTYRQTQRPDTVTKNLSQGHFALLCINSPFAFLAPVSLWDNLKTMDDYAEKAVTASYLRIVRFSALFTSIIVSPIYLAFVTYNHIIVPQSLALNIAAGREGVPFPTIVELLLMTIGMTVIREAALRIPGSVGYFVGTLSAVVIGQSAVSAGYVSPSILIVVAISEVSSFAISSTTLVYTSRLINYLFIILAGISGMFGLINGIVILFWHLSSLESFGVPYLYPLVPFELSGMKDTFIRMHLSVLKKRLKILAPSNQVRMGDGAGEPEQKKLQAGK